MKPSDIQEMYTNAPLQPETLGIVSRSVWRRNRMYQLARGIDLILRDETPEGIPTELKKEKAKEWLAEMIELINQE